MRRIFIMLGAKCNLQCKYCLQHEMVNQQNNVVSLDVLHWVAKQAERNLIQITFYGGEPLVYWTAIQKAVKKLETLTPRVRFGLITNGKLIDDEKVLFMQEHDFSACVSWDGANVLTTRGYDALNTNAKILEIPKLTVSAVMSRYTYPKDFLDSVETFALAYRRKHYRALNLNIDTILDFGNCSELVDIDLDKVSAQMREIMLGQKPVYKRFANQLLNALQKQPSAQPTHAKCGNGIRVWNVDTVGNVYRCHNCGEKIGTIFDDADKVMAAARELDPTAKHYEKCSTCEVSRFCRGGCPLLSESARESYYCTLRKAYLTPVFEYAENA